MPAWEKEVEEALEEGVVLNPSWGPERIVRDDGRVAGVEFKRCVSVFDAEGRFAPRYDEETVQRVAADGVIISIGQAPDMSFLSEDGQLERELWGTLVVDENTLATNIPGIFAGGDFTTGPTFVIRAIASGRRAALAIDQYLRGGQGLIRIVDEKTELLQTMGLALDEEAAAERLRVPIELERPEDRVSDFREVEKGFSEEQARMESTRCLRCDLEKDRSET
jgi:NADH-quinone oxidoreductase subunit F